MAGPTNKEKQQPLRRVELTRPQALRNERPQPRPDDTEVRREWLRQHEATLLPMRARPGGVPADSGGLPGDQTPPSRMACMTVAQDNCTPEAYDEDSGNIYVAHADQTISVVRANGAYFERIEPLLSIGEDINVASAFGNSIVVATPTKTVYYDDYRDPGTATTLGFVSSDVELTSTRLDTDPSWTSKVTASYTGTEGPLPEKLLITVEATAVTIWDVTSGAPISYMVFTVSTGFMVPTTPQCVAYREGVMAVGLQSDLSGGIIRVDFVADEARRFRVNNYLLYGGDISERNAGQGFSQIDTRTLPAEDQVDIVITADGAAVTNGPLLSPRIGSATASNGCGFVLDDLTTSAITGHTDQPKDIDFWQGQPVYSGSVSKYRELTPYPLAPTTVPGQRVYRSTDENAVDPNTPHILNELGGAINRSLVAGDYMVAGSVDGLTLINLEGQLAGSRVTSTGDTRVTSAGDRRITNG